MTSGRSLGLPACTPFCGAGRRRKIPPYTGRNGPTTCYNPLLTRLACILVISFPSLSSYVFSVRHHHLPSFYSCLLNQKWIIPSLSYSCHCFTNTIFVSVRQLRNHSRVPATSQNSHYRNWHLGKRNAVKEHAWKEKKKEREEQK